MTDFKPGDNVVFTDKYGQHQVGTYIEPDKDRDGWALVKAQPFRNIGSDMDVLCLVPNYALKASS